MPMIHIPNAKWDCGHDHPACLISGDGGPFENIHLTATCPITNHKTVGNSRTGGHEYDDFVPEDHLFAFALLDFEVSAYKAQFN